MSAEGRVLESADLLNAMDAGIVILDPQSRVIAWNGWMVRFTRRPVDAVVGKALVEIFPSLAETRLPPAIDDSFHNGASSLLTHSLNKLFTLRDDAGNELLHNVIVRPVASGPSQLCLLQINDVTVAVTRERVLRDRQNARYRAIVDTAPDAIITVNSGLSIQWLNATAGTLFGYTSDELIGRQIDILLQNKNELTVAFLDAAHSRAPIVAALQLNGRRKDGSVVPFEVSIARWKADDRAFMTTIWRDVTERVLADQALRQSEARLRNANEELEQRVTERTREREVALAQLFESQKMETIGQLTGGVAHDFNNLLSVVLGSLSLLKKRIPADPRYTRLLDGARQAAERGAILTKRLLAFARRQELKLEAVDVQSLIPEMSDFLRQTVGAQIEIAIDIAEDVSPIMIDANQLELAIMNLAVNGRDAMPNGGLLTIAARNATSDPATLHERLKPGHYVRLTIADTGEGMNESTRSRAMEPFFTTKGIGKGTGLGLSMVHGLAAQAGGTMDIASELGHGTVVTLWLPRAKHDAQMRVPVPAVSAPDTVRGRTQRILLVDDDVLVSMNTANMLQDLGHEVLEAHSGIHALQILESEGPFDAMITDYAMPGMTGLELAMKVHARDAGLRIVLATGYAELPVNASVEFPRLAKPYTQEELSEALERSGI